VFYDGEKVKHYGHSSIPTKFFKVFDDGKNLPHSKYQVEWFKNKRVALWAPNPPLRLTIV
jgi:hypothetical protein